MYICICKSVTDGQIRKAVTEKGINSMRGLRMELGACDQCGKCAAEAREIMRECLPCTQSPEGQNRKAA